MQTLEYRSMRLIMRKAAWFPRGRSGLGGIAEGLFKMALGNRIGAAVDESFARDLFAQDIGGDHRGTATAERAAVIGENAGHDR